MLKTIKDKYFSLTYWLPALVISQVKMVLGKKTGLPVVLPLLGFLHLLSKRKILLVSKVLLILPFISGLFFLFDQDYYSLARSLQLAGIFLAISAHKLIFKALSKNSIYYWIVSISLLSMVVEFSFSNLLPTHYLPSIGRFKLITGEPNYSAFILLIFLATSIDWKKNIFIKLALTILVILTMSRMGFLGVLIIWTLHLTKHNFNKFIIISLSVLTLSYPILLKGLTNSLSREKVSFLAKAQTRFYIHNEFIDQFLDFPLGKGYFKSVNFYKKKNRGNAEALQQKYGVVKAELNEQHNTTIQVLSDFGIIGYLTWLSAIILIVNTCLKARYYPATLILYLFCSSMLNTLNDLGMIIAFSMPFAASLKKRET
jgi:hypothetical protein